jgi:predicted nuclease of predicted toxin-antitoxin system
LPTQGDDSSTVSTAVLKLLADENIDAAIIAWLRSTRLDVAWIAEIEPSISESAVIQLARSQDRTLLANDLDFGELAFR